MVTEDDIASRQRCQPGEHPLLSRLVILRVEMNHEFGAAFQAFDHELALIELDLQAALRSAT
jgi:hypothetical protein